MHRLRDGTQAEDPRLDRLVSFDERSRAFPIRALVPAAQRPRSWPLAQRLDQGQEGACVGFSMAHRYAAQPGVHPGIEAVDARDVYWNAQRLDEWPGGAYLGASPRYEGTSVLAGAKACVDAGWFVEYRWAFGIDDVLAALSHEGPVVLGTWWRRSMFLPRPSGLLEVDGGGANAGGHAYCARGWLGKPRLRGEGRLGPVLRVVNSWGADWGAGGECFLRVEDTELLLAEDGEACVPLERR